MIWGAADITIIEIKCTVTVMSLNHVETIYHASTPSMEKNVFHKTGPWCQKRWGPCCRTLILKILNQSHKDYLETCRNKHSWAQHQIYYNRNSELKFSIVFNKSFWFLCVFFLKVNDILFTDRLKTVTPDSAKYTSEANYKELVFINNV